MISRTSCRRPRQRAALFQALAALLITLPAARALAQVRVDTGYNALAAQLGSALPTGNGVAVTQVEATSVGNYRPSSTIAGTGVFGGKTFSFRSPFSMSASGHAILVGNNYYGNGIALAPGITTIDSYEAGDWLGINTDSNGVSLGQGILRYNTANNPRVSLNNSRVVNHSWIFTGSSTMQALELLARNDWLIATDDIIQVAGTNNGSASTNQALFTYGANTISVGLSNQNHGKGTPTALTPDSNGGHPVYGRQGTYQHPRPDLVVPQEATSWATPVVGSAVALLIQASRDNPSWSTVSYTSPRSPSQTIRAADTSEVIRASLLAGADRTYYNTDGVRLFDYRATVGTQAANGLDTRVGAGQLNIHTSYNILAGGQHVGATSGAGTAIPDAGFDYDAAFGGDAGSNTKATYQFTGGWTGQNFTAALVWNADIDMSQVYPNVGSNPLFWTQNLETAANIFDFNLRLIDITIPGSPQNVAVSSSTQENTENIFTTLIAGRQYQLEVSTPHTNILWDYGLAWNGISNQLWNGTDGNSTWNVANAATWQRGTNPAVTFLDHDQVVFNDTADETTVNISSAVAPAIITVDNTAKNYIFTGTGSITGGTLIKQGTGILSLNTSNSYTGDTTLRAGILQLGHVSALGIGRLTISGGNLDSSVVNLVNANNNAQSWNADFTFVGTENLNLGTGAVTLNANRQVTVVANTLTVGGVIGGGNFALTKAGTGTLTLTGANVYSGGTNVIAGTLQIGAGGSVGSGAVTNNATFDVARAGLTTAAITGTGTTNVTASGASLTASSIRQTNLTIGAGNTVTVAPNGTNSSVSILNSLNLAGGATPTGTLDLKDNDLIIKSTDLSSAMTALATVTSQIRYAANDLAWNRAGITSSIVQSEYANNTPTALGFLLNNNGSGAGGNLFYGNGSGLPTFSGQPVDEYALLIKHTWLGDADLNGVVDSVDYSLFQTGFTNNPPYVGWSFGDFNYDGLVNSVDFALFQSGLVSQTGTLLTAGYSANSLSFSVVPEPGTWALLLTGLTGGLFTLRRWRKTSN
jgi:autotransporter-associated beta strand protein